MTIEQQTFDTLKQSIKWGARRTWWEFLITTTFLPAAIGIASNLWTGADANHSWAIGWMLVSIVAIQVVMSALLLAGEKLYPFTIGIYCNYDETVLWGMQEAYKPYLTSCKNQMLVYLYSPHGIPRLKPIALQDNSPLGLGLARNIPDSHHILDDRGVFQPNGNIRDEVYFRRYATVPFNYVCSDDRLGMIVLTFDAGYRILGGCPRHLAIPRSNRCKLYQRIRKMHQ